MVPGAAPRTTHRAMTNGLVVAVISSPQVPRSFGPPGRGSAEELHQPAVERHDGLEPLEAVIDQPRRIELGRKLGLEAGVESLVLEQLGVGVAGIEAGGDALVVLALDG